MRRRAPPTETQQKYSSFNAASTLVYLILTFVSAWSLFTVEHSKCRFFSKSMLSLMVGQAFIGVVRYGHPDSGLTVKKVYDKATSLVRYVMLALINMDLYLSSNRSEIIAYLHIATIVLPIISHYFSEKINALTVDVSALINIVSCLYMGHSDENPWIMGLAAVAAMNHFTYTRVTNYVSAPKQDLLAIGLSFFNIFTVHALNSAVCLKTTNPSYSIL